MNGTGEAAWTGADPYPDEMFRPMLLVLSLLAGCAANAPHPEGMDGRSRDFSVDAVVYGPDHHGVQRARRPARYIVETDGTLRVSLGPGSVPETYPPPTRVLSDAEMIGVWRLAREAGLFEDDNPMRIYQPEITRPADGRNMAVVTVRATGRRWSNALLLGTDGSGRIEELLDHLAVLGWVPPDR